MKRAYVAAAITGLISLSVVLAVVSCGEAPSTATTPSTSAASAGPATDEVESLITQLQDGDSGERVAAARALREIRDSSAVAALVSALQDEETDVMVAAAYALGDIGDSSAVAPLVSVLEDPHVQIEMRHAAVFALGEIGDPSAVNALVVVLEDESELDNTRAAAAEALGDIGDLGAANSLVGVLVMNPGLQRYIAEALQKMGKSAIDELAAALGEAEDKDTAYNLAEALVMIGEPGTEQAVIDAMNRWGSDMLEFVALCSRCGNSTLDQAAAKWERDRGAEVVVGGYSFPAWGELGE